MRASALVSSSQAASAETGAPPALSTTGGTSDARFVKDHCPVVEVGLYGPTMHQVDEHVATADIETLTRIYARILTAYLAADLRVPESPTV